MKKKPKKKRRKKRKNKMTKKLIAGLGNPGKEYRNTRHNAGFMFIDKMAESFKLYFKPGKGDYLETKKDDVFFIKPMTYMNNSGMAILQFLQENPTISIENILVAYDDMDLPFGFIRIRKDGSSGGHKGIESIIYHLQSKDFCRLRIGIGKEGDGIDWVLSDFTREEMEKLPEILDMSIEAAITWIEDGIDKAMNRFNKKVKEVS